MNIDAKSLNAEQAPRESSSNRRWRTKHRGRRSKPPRQLDDAGALGLGIVNAAEDREYPAHGCTLSGCSLSNLSLSPFPPLEVLLQRRTETGMMMDGEKVAEAEEAALAPGDPVSFIYWIQWEREERRSIRAVDSDNIFRDSLLLD